ncbi:hypothetical protein [Aliamphritea spongicola]|nr:hypothetical protein [Aliamphritea spongicola]
MLERVSKQQQEDFAAVKASDEPLKMFISRSVKFFAKNQPITRLIADEVIAGDSELKKVFIATLPKRTAEMLPELIAAEQKAGRIKGDMNPKWLGFSLINMIITPFVAVPVREQVWQISHDEIASDAWAEHVYRIFTEGLCNEPDR